MKQNQKYREFISEQLLHIKLQKSSHFNTNKKQLPEWVC